LQHDCHQEKPSSPLSSLTAQKLRGVEESASELEADVDAKEASELAVAAEASDNLEVNDKERPGKLASLELESEAELPMSTTFPSPLEACEAILENLLTHPGMRFRTSRIHRKSAKVQQLRLSNRLARNPSYGTISTGACQLDGAEPSLAHTREKGHAQPAQGRGRKRAGLVRRCTKHPLRRPEIHPPGSRGWRQRQQCARAKCLPAAK